MQMQKYLLSYSGSKVDIRQVVFYPLSSLNGNQGVLKKKPLRSPQNKLLQ